MSARTGTAREALLAEVLGDLQLLLERVERADTSAKETAQALKEATAAYRSQVDDLTNRLRSETANIITQTTEHAAKTLVGQQAATLERAASMAMHKVLTQQLLRRIRFEWLAAAGVGAAVGFLCNALSRLASSMW